MLMLSSFAQAQSFYSNVQIASGIGFLNSKTFGEFARTYNEPREDLLKKKLRNFGFSYGYNIGVNVGLPGWDMPLFGGVRWSQQNSMAKAVFETGNVRRYQLQQNQLLFPIGLITDGEQAFVSINTLIGLSKIRVESTYEIHPDYQGPSIYTGDFDGNFEGIQSNIGLDFSMFIHPSNDHRLGFTLSASWLGNLLPMRSDRDQLFDERFYGSGAATVDQYKIRYRKDGEVEYVRADVRGLRLEAGLIFRLTKE